MMVDSNERRELLPFDSKPGFLGFDTSGDWSVSELSALLRSLDRLYVIVMLTRQLALDTKANLERWSKEVRDNRTLLFEEMMFHPRFGPLGALAFAGSFASRFTPDDAQLQLVDRCLVQPSVFMTPDESLMISSIKMASPGGFNLRGLGEPIKQLRELLKDLFYRNKQEKKRGELAILREQLQLVAQYGLPEPLLQKLVTAGIDDIDEVRRVIASGKLQLTSGDGSARKSVEVQPEAESGTDVPKATALPSKPKAKRRKRTTDTDDE
jgi:hypothetical protein